MKYFIDTEFIEGFHKPIFGKRRHFIDLISIGIVAEDGREYYAISNEFNPKDADQWVQDNVISKLPSKREARLWKSNAQIAKEIRLFVAEREIGVDKEQWISDYDTKDVQFYAYYADYDWVLFCSLFGTMISLPKGFPMYCRDLKQVLDEKQFSRTRLRDTIKSTPELSHHSNHSLITPVSLKDHPKYPKQTNEHHALADARWNKSLYDFLQTI